MFPRNENRNEGTFGCSPGTRIGTRARSHVPPVTKTRNEGTVDTEIKVKLIPRKYLFAFAFVFIFLLYYLDR